VIVAQPGLGAVQRPHVLSETCVSLLNKAQRVPQRLDFLPPRMEVRGAPALLRALHRLAPTPMQGLNPMGQRGTSAMHSVPVFRVSAHSIEPSIDDAPRTMAFGRLAGVALLLCKPTTQSGKRVLAEQTRMPGMQIRDGLHHDVGVSTC